MYQFRGKTEEEMMSLLSAMSEEDIKEVNEDLECYLINNLNSEGPAEEERIAEILSKILWEDKLFSY